MSKLPPRIKPGDRVFVKDWPPQSLEVVDCSDRSIVTLRSEYGVTLKVGRLAVVVSDPNVEESEHSG